MMKEKHPWQVETQMVLPQTKRTIKNTLVVQNSVLSDSNKGFWPEVFYYFRKKLPLSQKLQITSEGVISHQLSVPRYQVRFYANIYRKRFRIATHLD